MPPFELMTKSAKQTEEYAKIVNDGFAELCAKDPDHFPGWVAQCPMTAPDVGVREAARAMKMGALGVQIYTNVAGKPLDNPEFEPFWKAMNKTETPIWLHPSRTASFSDYQSESKSKYEIWWTLGWSYETAAAMSRLVFSKIMDKYPNLKIIAPTTWAASCRCSKAASARAGTRSARAPPTPDYQKLKKSLKKPRPRWTISRRASTATPQCSAGSRRPKCGLAFYQADRKAGVRLGLPVRSRERHLLHPRDLEDFRQPRSVEGQESTRRSCTAIWRRSPGASW